MDGASIRGLLATFNADNRPPFAIESRFLGPRCNGMPVNAKFDASDERDRRAAGVAGPRAAASHPERQAGLRPPLHAKSQAANSAKSLLTVFQRGSIVVLANTASGRPGLGQGRATWRLVGRRGPAGGACRGTLDFRQRAGRRRPGFIQARTATGTSLLNTSRRRPR